MLRVRRAFLVKRFVYNGSKRSATLPIKQRLVKSFCDCKPCYKILHHLFEKNITSNFEWERKKYYTSREIPYCAIISVFVLKANKNAISNLQKLLSLFQVCHFSFTFVLFIHLTICKICFRGSFDICKMFNDLIKLIFIFSKWY